MRLPNGGDKRDNHTRARPFRRPTNCSVDHHPSGQRSVCRVTGGFEESRRVLFSLLIKRSSATTAVYLICHPLGQTAERRRWVVPDGKYCVTEFSQFRQMSLGVSLWGKCVLSFIEAGEYFYHHHPPIDWIDVRDRTLFTSPD